MRAPATVELFERIIAALVGHPDFRVDLPTVWDMRESEGFGDFTRPELSRLLAVSRSARAGTPGYRVAMVTQRDVDFGVGRMMGAMEQPTEITLGVFRDIDEARRWAFGPETS
ncbi:MAG: hypothetical protein R3253_17425 [Longimicrobiales bacterium]|nr:hypothetical protein [Longimicrobiales bacterium]